MKKKSFQFHGIFIRVSDACQCHAIIMRLGGEGLIFEPET
jgi:hypothetical protein